ncbi:MAG: hypothetical protein A3F47_01160 [Candidatus Staskawiczbacteria bacterium RIFCSPHIGHO2_12_FULL_38_11]|uniref:Uncharacterized protein n=1 Tax=Candidatus Staskawiczbacteria bacterium RIFCSPHIGHO2_12_FULL_38_11 TaxID=1802209 RepID=A0A1G2I5X7_9BACT|nr:MAG: hypothetical protein A3F47_01160 [Candidatus Staskawiczbacteria bacterium RIFCSPHIGHO2_12_FULL_38_11]
MLEQIVLNDGELVELMLNYEHTTILLIHRIKTEERARRVYFILSNGGHGPICYRHGEFFTIQAYPKKGVHKATDFLVTSA